MASSGKLPESLDPRQMSLGEMDDSMPEGMEPQIGDVVELRSGSPPMTVTKIDDEGLTCVWFAETEERFREQVLPAAALIATIEMEEGAEEEEDGEEEDEDEDEDDKGKGKKGRK